MIRFIGNHTGPRQLELPPNIPDVDSAGSYWTRYSRPSTSNTYGSSRCALDTERMPCGPRNRSSSSMRASMRRSLSSLTSDRMWRPATPGCEGVGDGAEQILVAPQLVGEGGVQFREAGQGPGTDHGGRAHRQEADERTDLQALAGPVGEAEHVVEEAVLVVPDLVGVIADRVDRCGDPEEPLDELQHEIVVGRSRGRRASSTTRACSG